ncbi:hypothetical protein ACF1HJ_41620 [Streptomyces sp. NPDC013978]
MTAQVGTAQAKLPAATRVLLADPAAVTVEDGHRSTRTAAWAC